MAAAGRDAHASGIPVCALYSERNRGCLDRVIRWTSGSPGDFAHEFHGTRNHASLVVARRIHERGRERACLGRVSLPFVWTGRDRDGTRSRPVCYRSLRTAREGCCARAALTHSRPHVSDDNPYPGAQFKTLKYRPDFPARAVHGTEPVYILSTSARSRALISAAGRCTL